MTTPTSLIIDNIPLGWQTGFEVVSSMRQISTGDIRRTWNAVAVNLGANEFRKYALSLSSSDTRPPAWGSIWVGTTHQIVPVSEIGEFIPAGSIAVIVNRDIHPGSVRCIDPSGYPVAFSVVDRSVSLDSVNAADVRVYYRPVLNMITKSFESEETEASGTVSWSWELEEV